MRRILLKNNPLVRAAMTLLFTLVGVSAWADDPVIVIKFSDGTSTEVLFGDMPEFTYADGDITLKSDKTELSWPIENLERFTFENVQHPIPTVVRDIKTTGLDILSDKFEAYDLQGRLVKKNLKSLSELPKGTYIIKDGSVTIKVMRK